jgi:hypothetical protein
MNESRCHCRKAKEAEGAEGPVRSYAGLPVAFMAGESGEPPAPAPFLMDRGEVIRFLRLNASGTRFPAKAIQRYRHLGLKTLRIGRCVWFRLDDVLRFMDRQQARMRAAVGKKGIREKGW